jgi:hypothetical protein
MQSQPARHPQRWRTVEDLLECSYQRSRVVMINECHAGWFRCIRTRRIGQRLLPMAQRLGVRHLAMEALSAPVVAEVNASRRVLANAGAYLHQPEMRAFVQSALDLGLTLIAYEANFEQEPAGLSEREQHNWRELMQARNLIAALARLPAEDRLLVWCGNNHHTKARVPSASGEPDSLWELMGYHFREQSGLDPFVIDQGSTVLFPGMPRRRAREQWLEEIAPTLITMGGTAGFLSNEAPSCLAVAPGNDAEVISLENEMEEWDPSEHQAPGASLL